MLYAWTLGIGTTWIGGTFKRDVFEKAAELFFDQKFGNPLVTDDKAIPDALEMVRLAPSAVNKQPWRIVKDGNKFHFFIEHAKGYSNGGFDMQKIDMGIALCHFMSAVESKLELADPGIELPENTEYIATVAV